MFFVFSYTPSASNTAANPKKLPMQLSQGVIHQVDVLFQDGCNHKIFVQLYRGDHQVWPTNRGEKMRGNATAVSFREFEEIGKGETLFEARIWTTLSADFKEIIVQIGVLPKAILQPLSFEELLKAATGAL